MSPSSAPVRPRLPQLALGPLQYYWSRDTTLSFYRGLLDSPVDIVYLGETVCSRRHELRLEDWLSLARELHAAGKRVVLSSLTLIESESESESELKTLGRMLEPNEAQQCFAVEANDMAAVQLLHSAGRRDWIAGPNVNVFNPHTLALLQTWGACRWVCAPELSAQAIGDVVQGLDTPLPVEVLAWGRVPLAYSARCFTARHFNLQKDSCEFRCLGIDDGLKLRTREGEPFLSLNGVQTQSARIYNLLNDFAELAQLADVVRISPQSQHTPALIALFDAVRTQHITPAQAFEQSQAYLHSAACNGFWHQRPGLEMVYGPDHAAHTA